MNHLLQACVAWGWVTNHLNFHHFSLQKAVRNGFSTIGWTWGRHGKTPSLYTFFSMNMYIAMCTCVYIHEGKLIHINIYIYIFLYIINIYIYMKSLYLFTDIHPKLLFPSTHAISAWTSHHQAFQVDSGWSAAPFNHIKLLRTRTIITIGFICIYIYTVCIYIYM